jgi:RHS repeat-associated protein
MVPQAQQQFQYNNSGNLTADGFLTYGWDAENRLVLAQEPTVTGPSSSITKRTLYAYDYLGRRVQKTAQISFNNTLSWVTVGTIQYLYDAWNLLAEFDTGGTLLRSYGWGADDHGALNNAGGNSPILVKSAQTIVGTYYIARDVSGNVTGLLNATDGTQAAIYEYGPFGEPLRATGAAIAACPFRFAGKYWDAETRLSYYGHRYFSSSLGRWISRDPLEESGGPNLYCFVNNDPVNQQDLLGLESDPDEQSYLGDVGELLSVFLQHFNDSGAKNFLGAIETPWILTKAFGRILLHPIQFANGLATVAEGIASGELPHYFWKCVIGARWDEFLRADPHERNMIIMAALGDAAGFVAAGGVLKELQGLAWASDAALAAEESGLASAIRFEGQSTLGAAALSGEDLAEAFSRPGVQAAYRQIRAANFEVVFSRGPQPDWVPNGTLLQGFTDTQARVITVYLENLSSAEDVAAVLAHESSHAITFFRHGTPRPSGTFAAEYAADLRQWLIRNGARPSLAQREAIRVETMMRIQNTGLY